MAFASFRLIGQVFGATQLAAAFAASSVTIPLRARQHLRLVAEEIRTESMRLVPVDTGRLKGTAFVRQVGLDTVEVGYGTDYALYVHEIPPPGGDSSGLSPVRPAVRTARHEPPTQWKFLELPARRRLGNIEREFSALDLLGGLRWRAI